MRKYPAYVAGQVTSADSAAARWCAVTLAIALTADTPPAPKHYERQLLDRYQRGELSIE